jgi:hypothetical protein
VGRQGIKNITKRFGCSKCFSYLCENLNSIVYDKTTNHKPQTTNHKIKHFLGLFLILVLLFQGCRLKEDLPAPEAPLNPTIERIKAWYNPKIERLKGQKSTGTDIYYPQWEQGLIHNLPNGEKVAVFPVMRERRILYFNTGFVRKFVVKLNANDSIQSVKLLEMIGKKEYLRDNHNEVARRHYSRTAEGMPVVVIERPVQFYVDKSECDCSNSWILFWYEMEAGGGGGFGFMSPTGVFSFYDLTPTNPSSGNPNPVPSGGDASWYGLFDSYAPSEYDIAGGSGASAGTTPTPDNSIYVDWAALANSFNFSAGWGLFDMPPFDWGWNVGLPNPFEDKVTLDNTFKADERAMCIYNKMKDNQVATFNQIADAFKQANIELVLKADTVKVNGLTSNLRSGITVTDFPRKVTITLNKDPLHYDSPVKFAAVLLHEMLHAYWHLKLYQIGGYQNLNTLPAVGNNNMNTSNPEYADLKWAYNSHPHNASYGHNVPHHNLMAREDYRNKMANALMEWNQNTNSGITLEECKALSREGLFHDYVPANSSHNPKAESLIKNLYYKSRSYHCY